MTERSFNLVVPLAHEATAMRLTAASASAYSPSRQKTTGDGLGGPIGSAARSRMVLPSGYFFALGAPFYGRTGRGGRKAYRLLNPVRQPRPVPLTLLGGGVRGSLNEPEFSTMATANKGAIARRRSQKSQPCSQFSAKILKLSRHPRLRIGDLAEICGDALSGNIGKAVLINGFTEDGWVEIESISGLLDSRDIKTGVVTARNCLSCIVRPENLYRLDNSMISNFTRRIV